MTIMAHQTPAYGQWRAVVMAADGTEHEGWGLTEAQATYRAQVRATQEPCKGCGRPVSAAVAAVSRRSHGAAFCEGCRSKGTDDVDFFKEDRRW